MGRIRRLRSMRISRALTVIVGIVVAVMAMNTVAFAATGKAPAKKPVKC